MINPKDIASLLALWQKRLNFVEDINAYDALNDCIYELSQLYMYSIPPIPPECLEEIPQGIPSKEIQEYLDNIEADDYLSTIEAHDRLAV